MPANGSRSYLQITLAEELTKVSLPYNITETIRNIMATLALAQGILSPSQVSDIPNSTIIAQFEEQIGIADQEEREKVERELKKVKSNQSTMLEIAKETGYGSGNYGG
ncbi:hypothetical protein QUA46_24295 [Microcoleus sp. MON2_D6]|uniref:hypothetical protein n=1 Tax=unclassified Microcoleus TaxID=2642155 RepID=UPI002FD528B4